MPFKQHILYFINNALLYPKNVTRAIGPDDQPPTFKGNVLREFLY